MDQFLAEIETYARASGLKPQAVLRHALGAGWGTWARWRARDASPTMISADRVRAWMAENPPLAPATREAAE